MGKILHPYQEEGIRLIGEQVAKGHRAVCFVLPTGTGKTLTLSEVCKRHIAKVAKARILWMVHREELVSQAYDALTERGLSCGVVMATPTRECNPWRPVQIASIQTLVARKIVLENITLAVHDEAHHGPSKSWITLPNSYKAGGTYLIGPTATPMRGDGVGLGDIYDVIVEPLNTKQAIASGYLCQYEIHRPPSPLRSDEIAKSPVYAYQTYANGGKAIVFAPHISAGESFLQEFTAAGIPAVFVTGKTETGVRRESLSRYAKGEIRVLINVGVATEGFDDPSTNCIILARAIGSVGLFLQILGRGLRTHASKKLLSIVDLHGSSWIHGNPEVDAEGNVRVWSLEGMALKPKDPNKQKFCPICGVLLEKGAGVCDLCAILRPDLVPPTVVNVELVKYAAKKAEVTNQRAMTLARWMKTGREKGYASGASQHKYKAVYGEWPPGSIQAEALGLLSKWSQQGDRLDVTY